MGKLTVGRRRRGDAVRPSGNNDFWWFEDSPSYVRRRQHLFADDEIEEEESPQILSPFDPSPAVHR